MGRMTMALVLAAVAAQNARAQGSVSGRVFDDSTGCPLRGARIAVGDSGARALTDANGRFRVAASDGARVGLWATLGGYQPAQELNVMVSDSTRVDFSMLRDMGNRIKVAYPGRACHLEPRDSSGSR